MQNYSQKVFSGASGRSFVEMSPPPPLPPVAFLFAQIKETRLALSLRKSLTNNNKEVSYENGVNCHFWDNFRGSFTSGKHSSITERISFRHKNSRAARGRL
jgi:hypothetical protein